MPISVAVMDAVRYHEPGEVDVLTLEEIDQPVPEPDEVLVEIHAASVNPVDAKYRLWGIPDTPKTTGSDLAGVVVATGKDVGEYTEGDRVFGTGLHTTRFLGGSFAEYATVPIDLIAPLPEGVSFEQGAAVALAGVTAWRAFVDHASLEPGETTFVHGGNGGVGHLAVGLADLMGARVVATARPEHHNTVHKLGAENMIDYMRKDLSEAAHEITDGADVILDHMPGKYVETDVEIAAFGGRIAIISSDEATFPTRAARSQELVFHMVSMSNLVTHSDLPNLSPILRRLGYLLAVNKLKVLIDRTYTLEEADTAHQAVMNESIAGKILVIP